MPKWKVNNNCERSWLSRYFTFICNETLFAIFKKLFRKTIQNNDSDLIKIITGVRRCGKSVILETIINEIKIKTDNIIYLNFEKVRGYLKQIYESARVKTDVLHALLIVSLSAKERRFYLRFQQKINRTEATIREKKPTVK